MGGHAWAEERATSHRRKPDTQQREGEEEILAKGTSMSKAHAVGTGRRFSYSRCRMEFLQAAGERGSVVGAAVNEA